MKRKINNPYTKIKGYNCFGCSPHNENGLRMQFVEDGDFLTCEWEPHGFLSGYRDILHGGIQATLMDEIAAWLIQVKMKTAGVTSTMNISLKRPVPVKEGKLKLKARLKEKRKNLVDVEVVLFNPDGKTGAEGVITYYTFSPEVAREKFYFPRHEDFFQ